MISLRHKLWIGYGALLLILLVVSLLCVVVLTRYSRTIKGIFHNNYDSVIFCNRMKEASDRLNYEAMILMWNPRQAKQIASAPDRAEFADNLRRELNNITEPGEAEHARHLAELWNRYQSESNRFIAAAPSARAEIYRSSLLPLFNEIGQTARWIADVNMSRMESVDTQVNQSLAEVRSALLALTIAGTLAASIVVGAAATSILHPLRNLTRSARQIESGNLDLSLAVRSRDEIGELAEAFNSMTFKLREFRRLDHDRLVRTQQTTQLAIDSLPDAVFIIGPRGIVEISNRTSRTHFGVEPGVALEQLGDKLKWLPPLHENALRHNKSPEPAGYRSAIQLFDKGEERFLLPRAVPMFGADNSVIGVCVILADVTRLRAADEAKSNLVSTVSHELRTPLTSIRLALNLVTQLKFGPLTPKQSALLETASQDSDRLHRIIENLLNFSRMESGRAPFRMRPISPSEIICGALDTMRPAFAERNLHLQSRIDLQLPQVLADPIAIGSALTNLLSNAAKFTPPGGEVSVIASLDQGMVSLSVTDTGVGIPEEFSNRIFEKFFRIPSPNGPSGAGLGLAIAKDIVEAHGGTIRLCRHQKVGSTFQILLPPAQSAK